MQKNFVLCRLKKKIDEKTNVSTCDEGEASSYTASDFEIPVLDDANQEVRSMPCVDIFNIKSFIWTMRSIFGIETCLFMIFNSGIYSARTKPGITLWGDLSAT